MSELAWQFVVFGALTVLLAVLVGVWSWTTPHRDATADEDGRS